jgi:hypothetical protein
MSAKRKNTTGGPQRPRMTAMGSDLKPGDVIFKGLMRLEQHVGGNDFSERYVDYGPGRVFNATVLMGRNAGTEQYVHILNDGQYEVR